MENHRFIVFNEDPFRIHDDDRQAFRIPAPYSGEIVDLLKKDGYRVGDITFEGIYSGKLDPQEWDTFIMPYGGLYPREGWDMIRSYLEGGGNLLTIGGPPFSRAFEKKGKVWPCDPYSPEIINGRLRLRWYDVSGFTYLAPRDDWKKILGFDRIRCMEPGVGIEAGVYLPDMEERCRDVEPL